MKIACFYNLFIIMYCKILMITNPNFSNSSDIKNVSQPNEFLKDNQALSSFWLNIIRFDSITQWFTKVIGLWMYFILNVTRSQEEVQRMKFCRIREITSKNDGEIESWTVKQMLPNSWIVYSKRLPDAFDVLWKNIRFFDTKLLNGQSTPPSSHEMPLL